MSIDDINNLLETELPDALQGLARSHTELQRLAEYGRTKHVEAKDKSAVTKEMQKYLSQSLEAVASEVAIFSHTFLRLLDSQANLLDQLTSCGTQIAFDISMKKEKIARGHVGAMTMEKQFTNRPPRSLNVDAGQAKQLGSQYFRKSIDYSVLDNVGFNMKTEGSSLPSNDIRVNRQSSQSITSTSSASQREYSSVKMSTKIEKMKQLNKGPIPVSLPKIPASGTSKEEKPTERAEDTTFVSSSSLADEILPDPIMGLSGDEEEQEDDDEELPPPPPSPPGYRTSHLDIVRDPVIGAPANSSSYNGRGDDEEELPPPPPPAEYVEDAGKEDWELELERAIAMLED